jgi:hypothetical protein
MCLEAVRPVRFPPCVSIRLFPVNFLFRRIMFLFSLIANCYYIPNSFVLLWKLHGCQEYVYVARVCAYVHAANKNIGVMAAREGTVALCTWCHRNRAKPVATHIYMACQQSQSKLARRGDTVESLHNEPGTGFDSESQVARLKAPSDRNEAESVCTIRAIAGSGGLLLACKVL